MSVPQPGGPEPRRSAVSRERLAAMLPPAAAILLYLGIAVLAYWPVEPFSRSHILGCACSDPVQETWFLAWPAYAIRHNASLFFSNFLEYPHGVNLVDNTSMPLLGLLGAPITWLRGPVATFNALMRLSFALSATSLFFVLRRFTSWWPAAFLGGLLYGFSPYMVGQGFGHLFLTFVPLPPLIGLCVYDLARPPSARSDQRAFVRRRGLTLGALCVLQFFISIEVLVTSVICFAGVAAVAGLAHPRQARCRAPSVLRGSGFALAVFGPFLAYPIWYFLAGRRHIVGPPHAIANIAPIKADLLGPIVPTLNQRIGPAHLIAIGTSYGAGDRPENGVYIGVLLLVLLAFLVVRFGGEPLVRLAAGLGVLGFVLSLGTPLVVNNHSTHIPLPFDLLVHVPLVQGVAALRFSLYEQLGAAVVLGVGLDRLRRQGWRLTTDEQSDGGRARRPRATHRGVAAGLAGIVALVPLLPRYPYLSRATDIPGYFVTGADRAIPGGSVVLTYPYDIDPDNHAMLWQAVSGMRFKIFGGQASTPAAGGRATSAVASLAPPEMQALFRSARYGSSGPEGAAPPPLDATTIAALRSFLVRYDVGTVLVDALGADPRLVLRGMALALDEPPLVTGGVRVWYGADRRAASLLRATAGGRTRRASTP